MSPQKHIDTKKVLEKAFEAIRAAEYNLQGGFFTATANRAYYACFYCMSALLYTQNVYAKTHQGTRNKFAELFTKTGLFPISITESINLLYNYRQSADYDLNENIDKELAELLVTKATEIYNLTTAYLQNIINQ